MSHYEGKKHAQKVRLYIQMHSEKEERKEHGKQKRVDCVNFQADDSGAVDRNKYCNLCNMIFTSPIVALSHYLGKIHAKKLKQLSGDQAQMSAQQTQPVSAVEKPSAEEASPTSKAEESSSSSNKSSELNDPERYCKLCCAPFNNPLVAHQHYVGKKHRRNEARKKVMEEVEDKAAPAESSTNVSLTYNFFSAGGIGQYICPICNITLSSLEMYQSHMQGNKHQTKETTALNLMKNSRKTYDSFQDELTDYIEVQKARDVESKTLSRMTEGEVFQDKDVKGRSDPGEILLCEQAQHSSLCSETQSPTNTGENPTACENTPENMPDCHYNVEYCVDKKASEVATIREEGFGLSAAKSNDCHELLSAETALSTCRKEQKPLEKHVEEEKYVSVELKHEKKGAKQKRKENSEDEDSGKESEQPKRVKVDVDLINEKKSKSYKGKRLGAKRAARESKRHKKDKKDKKKPQTEGKTEEELLWDESILGY
ncbi:PREDICTED: lysine-rich coiled-coil protein 1 [Tinamus guttatus]|uniref:lysine-rich coiled-coil protein 1 n=1 Tax=Tinamus guttatus TaxID=94827 RepID=UPI00052EE458|nr:PREDICTED: lysine-rich coiled-coil protein 1 [Tinamus guttatus]